MQALRSLFLLALATVFLAGCNSAPSKPAASAQPAVKLGEQPPGSLYLSGTKPVGLILAHGKGKGPAWLVVDPVRKAVNEELGYHTLSLQMPTGYANWRDYADAFPQAYQTIDQGIAFLRKKGVKKIFLFGHSMGSRMMSAYVATHPNAPIAGLIVAGCRNNGGEPLACDLNLKKVKVPVLDIWGGASVKDVDSAYDRKGFVSDRYQQVEIDGANHRFEGYEEDLVSEVIDWLQKH